MTKGKSTHPPCISREAVLWPVSIFSPGTNEWECMSCVMWPIANAYSMFIMIVMEKYISLLSDDERLLIMEWWDRNGYRNTKQIRLLLVFGTNYCLYRFLCRSDDWRERKNWKCYSNGYPNAEQNRLLLVIARNYDLYVKYYTICMYVHWVKIT